MMGNARSVPPGIRWFEKSDQRARVSGWVRPSGFDAGNAESSVIRCAEGNARPRPQGGADRVTVLVTGETGTGEPRPALSTSGRGATGAVRERQPRHPATLIASGSSATRGAFTGAARSGGAAADGGGRDASSTGGRPPAETQVLARAAGARVRAGRRLDSLSTDVRASSRLEPRSPAGGRGRKLPQRFTIDRRLPLETPPLRP
jgi:hypothetical protein